MLQKAHLYFHIVDVGCEAEDHFGVVRVVFAVSDVDVHVKLVLVRFDHHAGGRNEKNCQHARL